MSTRGAWSGLEMPTGLPDDQQRFVVREVFSDATMASNALPVARRLAGAAVDDQIVRTFGNVGIQIVQQHPQRGFLWLSRHVATSPRGARRGASNHGHLRGDESGGADAKIRN